MLEPHELSVLVPTIALDVSETLFFFFLLTTVLVVLFIKCKECYVLKQEQAAKGKKGSFKFIIYANFFLRYKNP